MLIFLVSILLSVGVSVLSSLTFWPVSQWYDFYKPLVMFIATYVATIIMWWCLIWLFGRLVNTNPKKKKQDGWSRFWLNDGLFWLKIHTFTRIKLTGLHKLPKTKYLLVCNHRSSFDPMTLIPALHREKLAFITKRSNFKIPLFTQFMKGLCYMPIDRENRLQSLEVMKRATELIQNNICSVVVYPEGTRQTQEIIGPFNEGVFNIAIHARCPIVIVTTKGTENIAKQFLRKSPKVRIDILGVYNYDDYRGMTAKALSDKIHKITYQHLDRIDVLGLEEK